MAVAPHRRLGPAAERIHGLLAHRGITQIDCPVSGGVSGATNGTLALMVSGPVDQSLAVHEHRRRDAQPDHDHPQRDDDAQQAALWLGHETGRIAAAVRFSR